MDIFGFYVPGGQNHSMEPVDSIGNIVVEPANIYLVKNRHVLIGIDTV